VTASREEPADRGQQARSRMTSFDIFYKHYYPRLVRFLTQLASDSRWSEEVADEAMMAALDNWDYLLRIKRPDS
jgi:DNA-directed RNA polymerase specialized sigma24 family protein